MKYLFFTIVLLLIVGVILYFYIKKRISEFTKKYFDTTSLKEAIEKSEIEAENTPKSISSMEPVLKSKIKSDFPDLNINEIKSMSETVVLDVLNSIEKKEPLKKYNDKIETWVKSKIEDLADEDVHFDSIRFHKTAISNYEINRGIASLYINTSLEYYYKKGRKSSKKVQDRFKVEYIYVIDDTKKDSKIKAIGLNCPNCGASIKSVGEKTCVYCGAGIKDIVKKSWSANDVDEY